jgi:hypothetical protein
MNPQIPGQQPLFGRDEYGRPQHHQTSEAGYKNVATFRSGTQKNKLLAAFAAAPLWAKGLTAEEAANNAGLTNTMYWCRVTELRADDFIEIVLISEHGIPMTRAGASGNERMVYAITGKGRKMLEAAKK